MSKVKVVRRNISMDMTAMCDVAFLLLTFFILTTQFKPDEAVVVDTPTSVSEIKLPDAGVLMINVDSKGVVYLGVDEGFRIATLDKIAKKYNLNFTDKEKNEFKLTSSVGVPVAGLKSLLSIPTAKRSKAKQTGIPTDSTNNELAEWILAARQANPTLRIAVKADKKTPYKAAKSVIATLQAPPNNINRFMLVTGMEKKPKRSDLN
jgi:biopolymer transport protein ExbD